MDWDVIVIGSGPGGLVAAAALARAGKRVLVVEQHYLPGGFCHSFTLEKHRFSPGVHYIGELQPGGDLRRLFEGLGAGDDISFRELNPDGIDHLRIGGEHIDVPRGLDLYIDRLSRRFPREQRGLRAYFADVDAVVRDLKRAETMLGFPRVMLAPFRAPNLFRLGFRTLGAVLDAHIKDPLLRAVLSARCGNHGLPPHRVSFPLHAAMVSHYRHGGFYPRGGGRAIPRALIRVLRRHGGDIRMRAPVRRILVEDGRAIGVELEDGEQIRSRHVVSNADPGVTYGELLPPELCGRLRRKAKRAGYSVSSVSVFAGTDMDLAGCGLDSGNVWWFRTRDVEKTYTRMLTELPCGQVDGLFLTVTSLKDPEAHRGSPSRHTLEMFTFVPYTPFERFRGADDPGYPALREQLGDLCIDAADRIVPGLKKSLTFRSVGTPLTNDFYCRTVRGAIYGPAKTPLQVGPFAFPVKAPVENLYCCGSSIISHGIGGAAMSGLMAAAQIVGVRRTEELLGPTDGSLVLLPAHRERQHRPARAA